MAPPKRPSRRRKPPTRAATRAQRDVLRAQGAARDRLLEREREKAAAEAAQPAGLEADQPEEAEGEAAEEAADEAGAAGDAEAGAAGDAEAGGSAARRRQSRPAARRERAGDQAGEGDLPEPAPRGLLERLLGSPRQRGGAGSAARSGAGGAAAADPEPWSLRGLYTLSLIVVFLQTLVWLVRYLFTDHTFQPSGTKLTCTVPFLVVMVQSDPIQVLLLTLVGMRFAGRISGEGRNMRILETLSYGAVAFMLGYFLLTITFQAVHPPTINSCDVPIQYVVAFAISTYGGFALAPPGFRWIYRRFWMPRRRAARR